MLIVILSYRIKDNGDIVGDSSLVFGTSYAWGGYGAPAGTSAVDRVSTQYAEYR